jgi:hypothetical protein
MVIFSFNVIIGPEANQVFGLLSTIFVANNHDGRIDGFGFFYFEKRAELLVADSGAEENEVGLDRVDHLPCVIRVVCRKELFSKGACEFLSFTILADYEDIFQGHTNLTHRSNHCCLVDRFVYVVKFGITFWKL